MNGNIFDIILIWPILNALMLFYKLFLFLNLPATLGLAIITLTVVIRLALWPLSGTQLKSMKKIQSLKPHLENIKNTHSEDKLRQQQETAKLYKEHGVNPMAGCLPTLIQIPFLIALYNVLAQVLKNGQGIEHVNKIVYHPSLQIDKPLDLTFLFTNLAQKPSDMLGSNPAVALTVPIITGLLLLVQSKMATPINSQKKNQIKVKDNSKKKNDMEDAMEQVQSQMLYIMPVMFAFFAFGFPLGLSLYWNTFTILGLIQQYTVTGWGGLTGWMPKKV